MANVLAALATASVVYTGCSHRPQVRPREVVVACGDGNFYVDHLRWQRWGATSAVASGIGHLNDCTPYCAAGHFHAARIDLTLARAVVCVRGRREFSTIRWRWLGARPLGKNSAETLPCRFLRLHP
jgi:hypothetical protein